MSEIKDLIKLKIPKITDCQKRPQVLPASSQSVDIRFEDIKYSVSTSMFNKKTKPILKGVSGLFKSGELTAIMGPSGAGKSSLLNVLSGFVKNGVEGGIYANDTLLDKEKSLIKNYCAYIQQDDYLNPLFSVREIMHHAADLKLSPATSRKSKQLLINDILESMTMVEHGNTRCDKLSGGQRKRLNICLELINDPSILYLDEPTSGLDSSSCSLLMSKLKGLAKSGRTVICTIHQPSASIFCQFDHLYLVSEGKSVYQGTPSNILPFLNCVGLACPVFHNPADFVMDVTSGEFGNYTEKMICESNRKDWRKNYSGDNSCQDIKIKYSSNFMSGNNNNIGDERRPSEWRRFLFLLPRMGLILHRDWTTTYLKLIFHILLSFMAAFLFNNKGNNGAKVLTNLAYFVSSSIYVSFTIAIPASNKFPSEMKILKKEHFNNWYKFTTYFFAFIAVNLPIQLLFSSVFTFLTYTITGQSPELWRFALFWLAQAFVTIISEFLGLMFGTLVNPVNGIFCISIVVGVLSLLGGLFVLFKDMPYIMQIVTFFGYMRYVFEVQVLSQYGFGRAKMDCPREEFYCHFRNPRIILEDMLDLKDNQLWYKVGVLGFYTLAMGYIAFVRVRHRLKSFY